MNFPFEVNETASTTKLSLSELNFQSFLKTELSFLLINVNGLRGKIGELKGLMHLLKCQFRFVALTEVKLTAQLDVDLEMDGYDSLSVYRNEFGGGIKLYFLEHLNVHKVDDVNLTGIHETHESLCVNFSISNSQNYTLNVIYRPPDKSAKGFCDNLEHILTNYETERNIFMGDFNLCTNEVYTNATIRDFVDLMKSYAFINCITKPTYVKHNDTEPSSLIDHIWHNVSANFHSYLIEPPMSDHLTCAVIFDNIKAPKNPLNNYSFRDYSMHCQSHFVDSIANEMNNFLFSNNNINANIIQFDLWFRRLTDKYFPIRTKFISKKRLTNPWLTTRLIKCIRNKHWLYGRLKLGIISVDMYKTYTTLLRVALKMAEQDYRKSYFDSIRGNSRKTWSCINDMLGSRAKEIAQEFLIGGVQTDNKQTISNAFADYFKSIPQTIKSSIVKPPNDLITNIPRFGMSMVFYSADDLEVERIVNRLKRSNEKYDISVVVLKLGAKWFSQLIAELFNQSMLQCTYPNLLKVARVSPIYKKDNRKLIENYRPVSVLPVLNKIFEKLVFKRINSFFNDNNLISNSQHGFRQGCSTDTAALDLMRHVIPAFSHKMFSLCVFLDQGKAFDLVEHPILLQKLERYGIRGFCLEYLNSYLNNRKSYVNFNNALSDNYAIETSVPQGSVLGPILFNIYTNDLIYYLKNTGIVAYADDTTLILNGLDLVNLADAMNNALNRLSIWCRYNGLSLNSDKTKFMIFTNVNTFVVPDLKIDGRSIEYVTHFKYLGLTLDHRLKFTLQIDNVTRRLASAAGISYRLGDSFNYDAARSYYFSFIYSVISYGIIVYGGCMMDSGGLSKLQKYQNKILLNLFQRYFLCNNINELYRKCSILKIVDIYRLRVATIVHKMYFDDYHPELFDFICEQHSYRRPLRNDDFHIRPVYPRVDAVKYSFQYKFASVWNDVPIYIRSTLDNNKFKEQYMAYLLGLY